MGKHQPTTKHHPSKLQHLKTLLKTQPISVTPEKAISGQIRKVASFSRMWGLRLAWSRLVDLGSIDSGSNPGGPTTPKLLSSQF